MFNKSTKIIEWSKQKEMSLVKYAARARIRNTPASFALGVFKIWQVADFCSVPIFSHAFGVEEFEYHN